MRALVLFLLLLSSVASAQFRYQLDHSIPVTGESGSSIKFPWGGGLNSAQVNTMDLNEDGEEDLIIFDRMADLVLTFVRDENEYHYAPEYEILFPEGITNWLLLRDFNGDGRKDIFTGDVLGVKVYVNKTQPGGQLAWQQFQFFSTGFKSPVILTKGNTTKIVMQTSYDDLPSIADADGDGDLDIFIMKFQDATIEYHRNNSVENYNGSLDSLDFERITNTWGKVRECGCGEFAFNNSSCPPTGKLNHAGGKSLFAFDVDADGDLDMLFSEAECDQLFLFENTSGNDDPIAVVIDSAVPYPGSFSVVNFPAPYYEDLDFDGIKDLLVSPNLFAREFTETNFKESVWFYKNTGTEAEPTFSAPQNFLQPEMIDVGDNAVPAFFDIDTDGDQDMFIGCYINNSTSTGSVYFFENTGTASNPEFTFVTDNYRALAGQNFLNIKPMFADMNGDSKADFVFTAQSGTTTQLYYIINTGTSVANFSGSIVPSGFLLSWRDENLAVADVNKDGKLDIIIGKLNGSLEYRKNTGTASAPVYPLENANFLNLSSTVLRQNPSIATGDLNNDGKDDLIYGDQTGRLTIISKYQEVTDASESRTEIVYNATADDYIAQNLGGRIWPTVTSLYDTQKPEIVIGNILGGLRILKSRVFTTGLPEETSTPVIQVYPNPVSGSQLLTVKVDSPAELQLITILGQPVGQSVRLMAGEPFNPALSPQFKGVYLLRFVIRGKVYTRKIVIR
jgi:FG-GAP-like repeat/FG-GAP repeat